VTTAVLVLVLILVVVAVLLTVRAALRWSRRDLRSTLRHHRTLDTLAVLAGGRGDPDREPGQIGGADPAGSDGDGPGPTCPPVTRGSPRHVRVISAVAEVGGVTPMSLLASELLRTPDRAGAVSPTMLAATTLPATTPSSTTSSSTTPSSTHRGAFSAPWSSDGHQTIGGRRLVTIEELGSVPLSRPRTSVGLTVSREETAGAAVGGVRVIPAGFTVPGAGHTIPAVRLLTDTGAVLTDTGSARPAPVPASPSLTPYRPGEAGASPAAEPFSGIDSRSPTSSRAAERVRAGTGADHLRIYRVRRPSQLLVVRVAASAAALVLVASVASLLTHHGSPTPVTPRAHAAAVKTRPSPVSQQVAAPAPPVSVPVQLIASNSTTTTYQLTGSSPVTLQVTGDCWVDVHHGSETGPSVLTTTLVPGETQSFSGPVWMRLGNPTAVAIHVGTSSVPPAPITAGQPYDLDFQ
jgi:hypothetical protein